MRSVVAILVGFVLIFVLSVGADLVLMFVMPGAFSATGRVESTPVLLLIVGYVLVFAVAGCYLTARLAGRRAMAHALVLGLLGLAFTVAGTAARWDAAPLWYNVVSLATVLPAAWLGGWLREAQLRRVEAS